MGIFLVVFYAFILSSAGLAGLWDEHTFSAMTPAQHLAEAKEAVQAESGVLDDEGLRHAKAVPENSPEAQQAKEFGTVLVARLEAKKRASQAAQQAALDAKNAQAAAVRELQDQLKNLGYEVTVAKSEKAGEIVITSGYFSNTDNRVKFLAFIRGRNSPTIGACFAGFQSLLLRDTTFGEYVGFSESYPLDCFNLR